MAPSLLGLSNFLHASMGFPGLNYLAKSALKFIHSLFFFFFTKPPPRHFLIRCCRSALLRIHGGFPLPASVTQFKYTTARGVECHYVNMVPETSVRLFVKSKLYLLRGWEGEHSCC